MTNRLMTHQTLSLTRFGKQATQQKRKSSMRQNQMNDTGRTNRLAVAGVTALSAAALLMSGCATGAAGGNGSGTVGLPAVKGIHGLVYGGQQPISGSTVQLYAMGTTGNASVAKALIATPPTTDSNGNFNITSLYTCPAGAQVYITSTSGDPQITPGTPINNTAIALMADLGDCATLQANAANTYVTINEVTTAAAVYALGSFISDYTNVGYASSSFTGVQNALVAENALASTALGTAPGQTVSGVTLPTAKLNSLANAIAGCVNSTGATSSGCSTLFTATGVGTGHQNTIAVLAAIAHAPGSSVAAIYGNASPTPPFQPTLSAAPADWTMPVYYTGGGLSTPNGIAIDASGSAWIANQGSNSVTKIAGVNFASGTTGYTSPAIVGPQAVAIDAIGNVWLANTGADSVLELSSSTGAIVQTVTSNLSAPNALAFDGSGNLWVSNFTGNSVAEFDHNGNALASPFTSTSLTAPTGVAIDASNTVWVSSSLNGVLSTFNVSGANTGNYTDSLMIAPGGVATDSTHSRVWTAATGINAIVGLTGSGAAVSGEPFATGVTLPMAVAVDGAGTVWTANYATAGTVSAFTYGGALVTPATGLGSLSQPTNLAIDGSGNVWVTSMGDSSVTQFIGLASAVATPLVSSSR
jgi:sugar lactone lactonase YvrE